MSCDETTIDNLLTGKYLAKLSLLEPWEAAYGTVFQLWSAVQHDSLELYLTGTDSELPSDEILEACGKVRVTAAPCTLEVGPSLHLLAVPLSGPLGEELFITTWVNTDSPELAVNLARYVRSSVELKHRTAELSEENNAYLVQLQEDMEELVFLRSIAERTALGGLLQNSHDLLRYVLPRLGEATGVEGLYFVNGRVERRPVLTESWLSPSCDLRVERAVIEKVVQRYKEDTAHRPVVRNHLQDSEHGVAFPGIDSFALVPVATSTKTFGWLVAVNRCLKGTRRHDHPVWSLGYNELGTCEVSLMSSAAAMLASHAHNTLLLAEQEGLLVSLVQTLVSAIESRDPYTCGHSERVARFAIRLAREYDFTEEECEQIYLSGLLHDIGKIGISDTVLMKPDKLTTGEYEEIKRHPDLGWAILRDLGAMSYVLPGILHHHERFDGGGYPDGLVGDQTPLVARLMAVVDAFDAMTSSRPYRHGMPWQRAVEILREGAGTQWDPEVVENFVNILPDILNIRDSYQRRPMPVRPRSEPESGEPVSQQGRRILPSLPNSWMI